MEQMKIKVKWLYGVLDGFGWLPPLLSRLAIGWVFLWAGYGKLGNLAQVTGFFESLGIPFASVQAPFIAVLELVGGLALILGLGTRVFSFLLASTMAVAILTAHKDDINVFSDIFKIYEFVYILVFSFLITNGAGKVSGDSVLKKKC
ncbi:MAG: DoxX family protein [Bdellovibrionales bacterium CG10_big_fil_rev_8_21_14_0_10_45_34]|nr:MAG: DoxX family protein [Bdellovibrionales bacterium CG10_big_fil_rev_8_21_14_0_10_45_34]